MPQQTVSKETQPWEVMRGLTLLMGASKRRYFKTIDQCGRNSRRHEGHPFNLDLPEDVSMRDIMFTGANATDMSVECFLAHLDAYVGHVDGSCVEKLRVIKTPYPGGQPGHHHVFFEAWVGTLVVISGETTDFSGAGKQAMNKLHGVFQVLSFVYRVPVEEVELKSAAPLQALYS